MVQVMSGASSRAAYYDRNPTPRTDRADVTFGSAVRALTTDWSRTIPAGKAAYLESLFLALENRSNTALNGFVLAQVSITPNGGTTTPIGRVLATVGMGPTAKEYNHSGIVLLSAGDVVDAITQGTNNAGGSDCYTTANAKYTEFDA